MRIIFIPYNNLKTERMSPDLLLQYIFVLVNVLRRRLDDKALPYFGPPRRFRPLRRHLSPPRRLGGGDSPQLALTP